MYIIRRQTESTIMTSILPITPIVEMWATLLIIALTVYLYFREIYSIEIISVGVIVVLLLFFHLTETRQPATISISSRDILSGFAAPALITIMALLVVGQALFHTAALETPITYMSQSLDKFPRRTLMCVFMIAFAVSMFLNNTPVVVMFIPIIAAMCNRLRMSASRFMMPLSFICILAGSTTLVGSSTNLLVNDVYLRQTGDSLGFFTQTAPALLLALLGALYIIFAAPHFLPTREHQDSATTNSGRQYIAQIQITQNHPLNGEKPVAGLYSALKNVTLKMIQSPQKNFLPPFDHTLQAGETLLIAAPRQALVSLLSTDSKYLESVLNIGEFNTDSNAQAPEAIVISEAVIAPGSRMIGRTLEQTDFRRQTGSLVLGIQRRARMIPKPMHDIRLEAGDVLLLFGYEQHMKHMRHNRDLLLLDWSTQEIPDIRKSVTAQVIFTITILLAATGILPIEISALSGALAMIVSRCINIRQAIRALDMKIFLLIGAAFAMGLALEKSGAAALIANSFVKLAAPYGVHMILACLFLLIAFMTNIISNSATALLFTPIALSISEQASIDPVMMILTVIFAANCCFATPIAYQTNLLVLGPGHYKFSDYAYFGIPLILLLWIGFCLLMPLFFPM